MRFCFTATLFAMLTMGCGNKTAAPLSVKGSITFMGRPLSGGIVVMTPDRDRGTHGKPILAEIQWDGRYVLPPSGISAGWYRVSISDSASWNAVEGFPASLRRPDRSGLSRELVAGREHQFDYHIDAMRP